jgi:hypothetical protein
LPGAGRICNRGMSTKSYRASRICVTMLTVAGFTPPKHLAAWWTCRTVMSNPHPNDDLPAPYAVGPMFPPPAARAGCEAPTSPHLLNPYR